MNLKVRVHPMKALIFSSLFILFSLLPPSANAACAWLNGWYIKGIYMDLPATIDAGGRIPIGSVIHTQEVGIGPVNEEYLHCTDAADFVRFRTNASYRMSGGMVTHPSAPGIAFSVKMIADQISGFVPFDASPFPGRLHWGTDSKFIVEFIKVSELGGQLPAGSVVNYAPRSPGQSASSSVVLHFSAPVTFLTSTCVVSTPVINVAMENMLASRFSGIGSVSPEKNFNIQLDCDPHSKVNLQIDGPADPSGAQGVLSLSSLPDSASGVGIQILHNNVPIALGQSKVIGTAPVAGIYDIPLSARYYQTQPIVNSGKADGNATFTVTYN